MPNRATLALAPLLALSLAAAPSSRPATAPAATKSAPATKPATTRAVAVASAPSAPSAGPRVGESFSPFRLTRVDGKLATNESLMGRPAVVVFGSWSSPSLRDQLPRVADLAARYGGRVNWLVVYTREQFPTDSAGGPERNREEKIDAPAAATDADRVAAAKRLVERLKLKLPVAPDAIDDRLSNGAEGFPNAAFVLDARGIVVAHLDWAEPFAIKRHLDRLLAQK